MIPHACHGGVKLLDIMRSTCPAYSSSCEIRFGSGFGNSVGVASCTFTLSRWNWLIVRFGRLGAGSTGFARRSRLRARSMLCLLSSWIVGRDSGMGVFLRVTR